MPASRFFSSPPPLQAGSRVMVWGYVSARCSHVTPPPPFFLLQITARLPIAPSCVCSPPSPYIMSITSSPPAAPDGASRHHGRRRPQGGGPGPIPHPGTTTALDCSVANLVPCTCRSDRADRRPFWRHFCVQGCNFLIGCYYDSLRQAPETRTAR